MATFLCLAGLAGVYTRLGREFPRGVTVTALALLFGATPLAWYTFFEPSIGDLAAFAGVAWLVALARQPGDTRVARWTRAGALLGLAAVPLVIGLQPRSPTTGSWLDVLFSSRRGLLWWTPVAYVAAVGTLGYLRRDWRWAIVSSLVLIATSYAVATTAGLDGGRAFGATGMIGMLAILAPSLALVLETLRRRPALALAPLVFAVIFWNHLLMVQYTVGLLPKDEPVSFGRLVQQQADAHLAGSRSSPFAFPANVWFAWRERLPVDRYDLLATAPLPSGPVIEFTRDSERFLLEGWDRPGTDGSAPVWWIGGPTATVAVPFSPPAAGDVRVSVRARTRHEEPAVEADLGVQVNGRDVGQFRASATSPTDAQFTVSAAAFRRGYNKIALVSRGVHRVDPGDTRPPGPIGRRLGHQVWPVAIYRIAIQ